MNNFLEKLNAPLPSAGNITLESIEAEVDEKIKNGEYTIKETFEGLGEENLNIPNPEESSVEVDDIKDIASDAGEKEDELADISTDELDDISGFDPEELDDSELMNLDKALMDDSLSSIADDGETEVDLTPSEEMEADDMMSVAATTALVKDELNTEERKDFLESEQEVRTAIAEGFLTESQVNEMCIEEGLVTESKYNNKMIIKLNTEAKKKQLYALALNVCAAAHHDPDYVKYKKAIRLKKLFRAKFERKYKSEALKRMKIYFKRLQSSKSGVLAKIASKFSGS